MGIMAIPMRNAPFVTLTELATDLRRGERPLLSFLDQLAAHFRRREPDVLAFLPEPGRFRRLRRQAEALLARYPGPATRPPLFGVPLGVKDIFRVAGFPTRAGSRLPSHLWQGPPAGSVARLQAAGALFMGKTVTTEVAFFAPGPTRNPHHPGHTPGGSSSGSAAAVAGGLSPLTLGSQTIGSTNRPAAYCGVAGFKPSYGRVSLDGVLPLSPSADTIGLFTPTAADLTLVMPLLDETWRPVDGLAAPRLGVPLGPYLERADAAGLAHFWETVRRLEAAGYAVVRIPALADFAAIYQHHYDLVAAEAAAVHADWFAAYPERYHAKTADLLQKGQKVSPERLNEALNSRLETRKRLARLMEKHEIDLWLSPPAPGAAPRGLSSTGDPVMNLPWTHAALPTITLPAGWDAAGLPLGLQLAGRRQKDEALLAAAIHLEASGALPDRRQHAPGGPTNE
jgi:Asp-tRNA(Asn)/Glu-tRNA(Gln) amidotransferase A subunit family amidase